MQSPTINKLIAALKKLPSVGQHTAQRYVYHWLKTGKTEVRELILALKNLEQNIKSCSACWNFSDTNPCPICADKNRLHSCICVVSDLNALEAIEKTGEYKGVYHVLRGTLENLEEMAGTLKIKELVLRVKQDKKIVEIILALNPDLGGETTALYLQKILCKQNPQIKITKLARGLPLGSDLEYADEITLGNALKNRL